MTYNPKIVIAYFKECGIPEPKIEHKFHPTRKWRFDFSWEAFQMSVPGCTSNVYVPRVALEVQGGLFIQGRHNHGASLRKEHEKLNEAARLGWRVLYVMPENLCVKETVDLIKACLGLS